jgi:flagellin-like protein
MIRIHCHVRFGHLFEVLLMKLMKNEEAVSPVIGVILMVAITVILAAVIAAFVFGMAGNISKTKIVAATASQQGATTIYVTYQGGQDAAQVSSMATNIAGTVGTLSTVVGATTSAGSGTTGQDHVTVTATFTDGSQQVILDTYV